jgi:hypothetical protein
MGPRSSSLFLLLFTAASVLCQVSTSVQTTLLHVSALERSGADEHAIELSRKLLLSKDLSASERGEALNLLGLSEDADVNSELVSRKVPHSPVAKGKDVIVRELLIHTGGITVQGPPGCAAGGTRSESDQGS